MKKIGEIATAIAESVIWKIADVFPSMSFVVVRRELLYAKRESAVMLELYRGVRSKNGQLAGKKLYEKIVAQRLECDEAQAREIIQHADESYARWPDVRDLTFRDVVRYVIVNHLITAHSGSVGTRAYTEETVKAVVPADL